jgi:23S rRNA (uracil1939-C5)-methyltransferase
MSEVVTVSGIAAGGDGVGRLADGRAVFLPRTAPGERVRLDAGRLRVHRHFARGVADEIMEPAPERVAPSCPHFVHDHCGGCQLQHLTYEAQLAAKRTIVGESLRRIGKLSVTDPEIVAATERWRYRSRIVMTVKGGGGGGRARTVGLHPFDGPGRVFPLVDCEIVDARLMALWREVRDHLDLLPARMTQLSLRLDRDGTRHVIAESPGEPWRSGAALMAALAPGDRLVCWWQPVNGAARVVAGPAPGFPPTAFEHDNPTIDSAVRRWVVDQVGELRDTVAWDLYGGIGDTAVLLAERGATVVSVDADEQAIVWARRRPEVIMHGARMRFVAGRAEDVLPSLPVPQVVVVAPPAEGLHWDVALRLGGDPVPVLGYVSDDPATLGRDLYRLNVNYRLRSVRAFDRSPHTAQVVTVAVLEGATA